MKEWVLYVRAECHLCDLARSVIWNVDSSLAAHLEEADIDSAPALHDHYCLRIPVLRHTQSQHELDWPFDEERLRAWLLTVAQ